MFAKRLKGISALTVKKDATPDKSATSSEASTEKPKAKMGRPKEESIKLSREARRRLDTRAADDADKIYEALLAAALGGCSASMSLLIQRIWPTRKGSVLTVEDAAPPSIKRPEDIGPAMEWVWSLVLSGKLSTDEGTQLGALIQQRASAFEFVELSKEIETLKEQLSAVMGPRLAA